MKMNDDLQNEQERLSESSMTDIITVSNDGPRLVETNFWNSALNESGKYFVTCNGGAIRLLLPRQREHDVKEMKTARYVIVSRGIWLGHEAVEFLFEDNSSSPFAIFVTENSCLLMPGRPRKEKEWKLLIYTATDEIDASPHLAAQFRVRWRRVGQLPCLRPWKSSK